MTQDMRGSPVRHHIALLARSTLDTLALPFLIVAAALSRLLPKPVDVGLGPLPTIASPYHRLALQRQGISAEVFVDSLWYYTKDYDYAPRLLLKGPLRLFVPYVLALRSLFRYRIILTYFDGGPLRSTGYLCFLEPLLLRLAGTKTILLGFGADVHVLSRADDPYFVHAYGRDYPTHRFMHRRIARKLDLWTTWADYIISGVDWVKYQHYWDDVCLAPFPIDTDAVKPTTQPDNIGTGPLKVLHAPNHRSLKGTQFLLRAIEELADEGVAIDLKIAEKMPNPEVLQAIQATDVVVDQLVVGWYAMFSIEAMALSTPCICYLDPDLVSFYERAGIVEDDEIPLINATARSIKDVLRELANDRSQLEERGKRGREFVVKHHSIDAVGQILSGAVKAVDTK